MLLEHIPGPREMIEFAFCDEEVAKLFGMPAPGEIPSTIFNQDTIV